MHREVVLEVCARVLQRDVMLLEQRVHVNARVQVQESTDLSLIERARAVRRNRDRLE